MIYQGDVNLLQVLDALLYLHAQSLIHSSLMCLNTLVRFDSVVKIGEQPLMFSEKSLADQIFSSRLLGA
jgi:serine/threonine protein kinase